MYLYISTTYDLITSNKERKNIFKKHFSCTGNFQPKTKLNVACGSHTSIMVESCHGGGNMVDLEDIAKSPWVRSHFVKIFH